jgi:hypothetical protein
VGWGYWIIIADGFGQGLNLINPRLFTQGGKNWWPCEENTTAEEVIAKHHLKQYEFFRVVF